MVRIHSSGGAGMGGLGITPTVKILLIANVAVYFLQNLLPLIEGWGVFQTRTAVFNFQIWRFATYMFMHGSFSHILFNMFGLWMFGSQIEALWGRRTFLTFYVICGLGGAVFYALMDIVGVGMGRPMLGASGAIFGILVAYGITFPNNVLLLGFIFPVKAKYAVVIFGLIQVFSTASDSGGGVAHSAHLGGMLAGFLFMWATMPSFPRQLHEAFGDMGGIWRRFQTKRNMRVVPPRRKPESGSTKQHTTDSSKPSSASPEQKKIDLILDKISRDGLQSLSDEEQEILRRAGRR